MSSPNPDPLERALETLLRPIVRLALKRGLAFGRFAEIVKRAYVAAAERDFAVPNRKPSVSRIAVLTGLTRKEASRLLKDDPDRDVGSRVRRQVNRAARVVTAWVEDAAYQDAEGRPLALPFAAAEGPSFSDLVARHGADVGARAVLDELQRVGVVAEGANGLWALVERAYVPSADDEAKIDMLGTDVADLAAAIENNLDADRDVSFFQRKVAYDALPSAYLPVFRARLAERGQALLEELNAELAAHDLDTRDDASSEEPEETNVSRAMVGVYYYEEERDEQE